MRLGDETGDRQYRSILSFNTSSLPDGAVVTSARIRLRREGIAGINPFNTHGALVADIRKGSFGLAALQLADFNAAANLTLGGAQCRPPPTGALYNLPLTSAALTRINNAGITQFRLRFEKDDNDDLGADYLRFYSGNAAAAYRPLLVVEYYIP